MNASLKKVSLIGVYLGGFPYYASLYFKSAGLNPDIKFLIFTDQSPPCALTANVQFIKMDREDFESLASAKLGGKMRLACPRKLCDYRPAFGLIFGDYLQHSDYWGHVDFDMVWGNISKFLWEPMAEGYQVISADPDRLCGPFTIYENSPQLRELFHDIPDVISKLNASEYLFLDEQGFDLAVKSTRISLLTRVFCTSREVSKEDLRSFISNDVAYEQILKGLTLTEEGGNRLPALWRCGELWNCLPSTCDYIRLTNAMFVHLFKPKVNFMVDLRNNLILPQSASAISKKLALPRIGGQCWSDT